MKLTIRAEKGHREGTTTVIVGADEEMIAWRATHEGYPLTREQFYRAAVRGLEAWAAEKDVPRRQAKGEAS